MAVLKDLIVHGASRFLNGINADSIETNAIKADSGIFNQLIATTLEAKNAHIDELTANNATVFGIMDVKGKLQTNQWEAANIANIGGNFYISPTGKSSSGTVTITRTSTATSTAAAKYSVAMSGTFGVSSTSNTIWAAGAYGMATGNVAVGTKKYPLGTCDGPLSNITTGTNTITGFTISNIESAALDIIFDENSSLISSNAISSKPGTDLQVSVYLGKSESNYMPIGILLTSYGKDNKQYIDIYDGTHSAGTSITGFAEPIVRIGDLSGLSPYTQSGKYTITPKGWGIYTSQGYFRGEVYSELGYIGGWTIDGTAIKTNNKASITDNTSGMRIDSANGIGFSGVTYFNKDGTGQVGPWTLSTTYFRNGNIANAVNTSVSGVYLGTDGLNISNGTAATTSYITKNAVNIGNKLTWNGSILAVNGEITASKLTISSGTTISGDGASQILNSEIEVGGRNLLQGTNQGIKNWHDINGNATYTKTSVDTVGIRFSITAQATNWCVLQFDGSDDSENIRNLLASNGENYTLSFDFRSSVNLSQNSATWRFADGNGSNIQIHFGKMPAITANEWTHIELTGSTLGIAASAQHLYYNYILPVGVYDIKNVKVEKGNKATDWTIAPEDVDSKIDSIEVGGRNLLLNTSNNEVSFTSTIKDYTVSNSISNVKSTDSLTISFWAKASVSLWTDFYFNDGTTSWTNALYFFPSFQLTTSWSYYTYTGVASEKAATSTILRFRQNSTEHAGASAVGTVYVKGLKLEKGNKATDWTPAPEDIDVNKYITSIDSNDGIIIKPANGTTTANTSTSNYLRLNSTNGLEFYKAGVLAASYGGSTAQIGYASGKNIVLDSEGVKIRNGNSNTSTLALYGSTTKFYKPGTNTVAAEIGSSGLSITNGTIDIGNGKFQVSTEGSLISTSGTIGGWTINGNILSRTVSSTETIDNESISGGTDSDGSSTDSSTNITITSTVTLDDNGIIFNGTYNGNPVKTSVQPTGVYSNSFYRTSGYSIYQALNLTGVNLYCFGNNKEILRFASKTTAVSPSSKQGLSFMIGNGYYTVGSGDNHEVKSDNLNMYLCGGTDETSKFIRSYPTYKRTYPGYSANVFITDLGTFGRITSSSIRYKHDVEYITNENKSVIDDSKKILKKTKDDSNIYSVLDIPLVNFKYNKGYITGEADFDYNKSFFGVIADDIASICPECATYIKDENGNNIPESYNINQITFRMLYVIQQQEKRIKELENTIVKLKEK